MKARKPRVWRGWAAVDRSRLVAVELSRKEVEHIAHAYAAEMIHVLITEQKPKKDKRK